MAFGATGCWEELAADPLIRGSFCTLWHSKIAAGTCVCSAESAFWPCLWQRRNAFERCWLARDSKRHKPRASSSRMMTRVYRPLALETLPSELCCQMTAPRSPRQQALEGCLPCCLPYNMIFRQSHALGSPTPNRGLAAFAFPLGFGIHSAGKHSRDPARLDVKSKNAISHPNSLTLELNSGQEDMSPSLSDVSKLGPVIPLLGDLCLRPVLQYLIQLLFSAKML